MKGVAGADAGVSVQHHVRDEDAILVQNHLRADGAEGTDGAGGGNHRSGRNHGAGMNTHSAVTAS
jgi:hypothetical protein